jgi:hypothetical protein
VVPVLLGDFDAVDRATRAEARDFCRWMLVAGKPERPHWRSPALRRNSASSTGATGSMRPWTLASPPRVVTGEPARAGCRVGASNQIGNRFSEACVKHPSEHDQVPPGLQVPSEACRREDPGLRYVP